MLCLTTHLCVRTASTKGDTLALCQDMQGTCMPCASALMQAAHITMPQCIYLFSHGHGPSADNAALCLQVSPELGNTYSDVLAAQDVALYGGLCALASFDRSEIKRHVVESIGFREMLELNPEVETTPASLSWCHAKLSQPESVPQPLAVTVRIVWQRHP